MYSLVRCAKSLHISRRYLLYNLPLTFINDEPKPWRSISFNPDSTAFWRGYQFARMCIVLIKDQYNFDRLCCY